MELRRRLPIGVELLEAGGRRGAHFRVWAPDWPEISLVIEGRGQVAMRKEPGGYATAFVPGLAAGARYRYRLGDQLHADPASRFQPDGPFGPSQLIDPTAHAWSAVDATWRGLDPARHVLYELHVGTFTAEGTYAAAERELPFLAALGVTTLELMPLAEFAGSRGWGYDGVNPFAPTHLHGTPDELRRLVDAAHGHGLAVILDVVYNHFGPSGNSLFTFAQAWRQPRNGNEWGEGLNYDGEGSGPVREFFLANAEYWISEFHLDGLRFDATQAISDGSGEHLLAAISRRVRACAPGRQLLLTSENEPQDTRQLAPVEQGGFGLDAMWNDDFHHAARAALTGVQDGYLHDYRGAPQELISALKRGFLYQGQMYPWQRNPRGSPTRRLAPSRFVHFLVNHDQEANVSLGRRLVTQTSAPRLRAMTAVLLLTPSVPLLFQGQETGTTRPWYYFADHGEALDATVRSGRAAFLTQFARFAAPELAERFPDPSAPGTFEACVLEPAERDLDAPWVRLHRDLLRLRREEPIFTAPAEFDGAVLAPQAFALRWFEAGAGDRLLLVNLGPALHLESCPEPLIAPPVRGWSWQLAWSSEAPEYQGLGQPPPYTRAGLRLAAESAVLLRPDPDASLALEPPPADRQTRWSFEP